MTPTVGFAVPGRWRWLVGFVYVAFDLVAGLAFRIAAWRER